MALLFDPEKEQEIQSPDPLAHEANSFAKAAGDAGRNREAMERQMQREKSHPMRQKLLDATPHSILLYLVFTAAYFLMLYWEWSVSREIYEILIPSTLPWVPFLSCVFVALYGSACLGETTTHFALFSLAQSESAADGNSQEYASVLKDLYDQPRERRRATPWFFHRLTGVVIAAVVIVAIYYLSRKRVELLQAAGEAPAVGFQTYLPVALYAIEILLGIPTFFCTMWAYAVLRTRLLRSKYTWEKRNEDTLRRAAVEKATSYFAALSSYNSSAAAHGKVELVMIPLGKDLRFLLQEEWGYDPTNGTSPTVRMTGFEAPLGADSGNPAGGNGDQGEKGDGSREQDLLNLLDEQINKENRGL